MGFPFGDLEVNSKPIGVQGAQDRSKELLGLNRGSVGIMEN